MQTGDKVNHPQWGKGEVLFDKPHCIGIKFIQHGHVNFTQEEWLAGHSDARRFRSQTELEYTLEEAVNNGDISEEEALRMLDKQVHPLEVRKLRTPSLNEAYAAYKERPENEDAFYSALLKYITALVKRKSLNASTFSNIEDSIQETAIEVWQRLEQFDPGRSTFTFWVTLITLHNIRDAMRRYRTSRGQAQVNDECIVCGRRGSAHAEADDDHAFERHDVFIVQLDDVNTASDTLPADTQLFLKNYLESLSPVDRTILEMISHDSSLRDIGKEVGLSPEAVRKHLLRLRLTKRDF